MHNSRSTFVANIVPLQNVQTNISGQGIQQTMQANIASLQSAVTTLQNTANSLERGLETLQKSLASIDIRVTLLEGKVG